MQIPGKIIADPAQEAEEFLYIVTHDLKAFARAMREIPAWILEDIEAEGITLSHEVQSNFDMLQCYAHRMDVALNALTDLSRIGRTSDAPDHHDLTDLIRAELASLPPSPVLSVEIECPPVTVFGPHNDLRRLFCHILDNVAVHHDRDTGQIHIAAQIHGGRVVISVSDDGPGIAPANREEMLKPLTTLKPKSETGHPGVGLAIARKIVTRLMGGILIRDGVFADGTGRGCSVEFDLPISRSAHQR